MWGIRLAVWGLTGVLLGNLFSFPKTLSIAYGANGIPGQTQSSISPKDSVIRIFAPHARGIGAGVAISRDRILTAAHVVGTTTSMVVYSQGQELTAKVERVDHQKDLALLSVESSNLNPVEVMEGEVDAGKGVVAWGNPRGQLKSLELRVEGMTNNEVLISPGLVPGYSGGGVFSDGKLVGISRAIDVASGEGKVIPIRTVMDWVKSKE